MNRKAHNTSRHPAKRAQRAGPFSLVQVRWEDSARPVSAWQWLDDYQMPQTVQCVSVGYLVGESTDAIALAPNLGDVKCERIQASGIIRIPRSAVRGMREL